MVLLLITCILNMLKKQGVIQNIAFVLLLDMEMLTQFQIFHPSGIYLFLEPVTYCVFLDKGGAYEHHFAQTCTPFVWLAQ